MCILIIDLLSIVKRFFRFISILIFVNLPFVKPKPKETRYCVVKFSRSRSGRFFSCIFSRLVETDDFIWLHKIMCISKKLNITFGEKNILFVVDSDGFVINDQVIDYEDLGGYIELNELIELTSDVI